MVTKYVWINGKWNSEQSIGKSYKIKMLKCEFWFSWHHVHSEILRNSAISHIKCDNSSRKINWICYCNKNYLSKVYLLATIANYCYKWEYIIYTKTWKRCRSISLSVQKVTNRKNNIKKWWITFEILTFSHRYKNSSEYIEWSFVFEPRGDCVGSSSS